jgi:thermitase
MRQRWLFIPLFVMLLAESSLLAFVGEPFESKPYLRFFFIGERGLHRVLSHRLSHEQDIDQILVKFRPKISDPMIRLAASAYQIEDVRKIPLGIQRWRIPSSKSLEEMIFLLSRNLDVEYVEPDYKTIVHGIPDDPYFSYQYALFNHGQEIGETGSPSGFWRADVKAIEGWKETTGDPGVTIAVIDTGVDFSHPDLKKNILPDGRDFVNDDFDPSDDNGHGTYICGIIAADTNNREGIAGITWNCRILPIKGISASGEGYTSSMIEAIVWAEDRGVDIINLSVGASAPSRALEEAIHYAKIRDILVVSSAGNHNREVSYPAAYKDCMAVAGTDYLDNRAFFSNFGPEIDVAAPARRIFVCIPTWKVETGSPPYGFISGTSLSCAYISGLAGLIKSIKPWLKAEEIKNIICFSADDINSSIHPGWDRYLGYGRANLEKALVPIKIK